jgi:hypothetical protein
MVKTKTQPQAGPGGFPGEGNGGTIEHFMPTQMPLANAASLKSAEGLAPAMRGMGDAAPALPLTQGVSAGITAWNSNKQITALWSINENRNSWVGIGGIGWKKLSNNSDSAIVALTMLSAHAREKGSTVHYRDESDGMIHEMYVW